MSDFRDKLRVNQEELRKSGKKVAIKRLQRILREQIAYVLENKSFTDDEKLEQQTVFLRMYKILENYDELEPVLTDFFREKAEIGRFNR